MQKWLSINSSIDLIQRNAPFSCEMKPNFLEWYYCLTSPVYYPDVFAKNVIFIINFLACNDTIEYIARTPKETGIKHTFILAIIQCFILACKALLDANIIRSVHNIIDLESNFFLFQMNISLKCCYYISA